MKIKLFAHLILYENFIFSVYLPLANVALPVRLYSGQCCFPGIGYHNARSIQNKKRKKVGKIFSAKWYENILVYKFKSTQRDEGKTADHSD